MRLWTMEFKQIVISIFFLLCSVIAISLSKYLLEEEDLEEAEDLEKRECGETKRQRIGLFCFEFNS